MEEDRGRCKKPRSLKRPPRYRQRMRRRRPACRSSKSCRCRCSSIRATRCTTPTTSSSRSPAIARSASWPRPAASARCSPIPTVIDADDEYDPGPRPRNDRHMRLRTRDGKEFPVEAFLQSVPWENGKALLLDAVARQGRRIRRPVAADRRTRGARRRDAHDHRHGDRRRRADCRATATSARSAGRPRRCSAWTATRWPEALLLALRHREPEGRARLSQRPHRPWRGERPQRRARGDRPRGGGPLHPAVHDHRQAARRQRLLRRACATSRSGSAPRKS